eukprot:TRINITY_DN3637_c0_g1_i1.p1 TRINITY_DN3637_c0_g1~~TRINITY_DN3637_c0_g1_i1.p1  ORF type:complete len:630 (-),score=181.49 TRINITY_DN3637_c0_g1_i1:120-1859(-)
MTDFGYHIAVQVAPLANLTEEQIQQCIEIPKNTTHADFAIPVAKLNKFKKLSGNPAQIASDWKSKIVPNKYILGVTNEGPYLNFVINKAMVTDEVLKRVFEQGDNWGTSYEGNGKTIIVEFSSPNMAKPFHAGHLRSTIIGNFLKNIHKALGYHVIAINYLGDWGKQYGLLALAYKKFGNPEELKSNPIKHLFEIYVRINKETLLDPSNPDSEKDPVKYDAIHDEARSLFKRMEEGDEEVLGLWKQFRELSIAEYKKIYKRLNVEFDVYSGESQQTEGMVTALSELSQMDLLYDDRGASLINLEQFKLPKVLVKKSDGATLYITRDIAAAQTRSDLYHFDKMFYVVAAQQDLHFQQLFKILQLMNKPFTQKCTHVNFGMVKGMSTRKGTVVFLEDILNEAKKIMLEVMTRNEEKSKEIDDKEQVADLIGLSAVVIQDFSAKRVKDYDFVWDRITSFEGDTGPYLQFQHARICSMFRKAQVPLNPKADFSLLTEPIAQDIARIIGKFPEVIKASASTLEPVTMVSYLFDLAHLVSQAHSVLWVKDREKELAEARMALFWAAKITLGNGLRLVGLVPLERM